MSLELNHPETAADVVDPRRWRALVVCLLAGFMTLLDVSIVNVALPSLQTGLHASPADVAWVRAGYTLAFGLALVPAGRLGDAFGRKRMFGIGLALFTIASLTCAVSPGPSWLVVARLFQGVAGGLLNPQVIGMIQQLFRGTERARAFGLYGGTIAVATAAGPLAGGLLIQIGGWRWVFLVNVPLGLLALVLGILLLPATSARGRTRTFDIVGVLLLGGGITSVMLPLIEQGQGAASARWWMLGLAAALLGGFVAWEKVWPRTGHQPLVDLGLLRTRSFSAGSAIGMAYFAGYPGLLFILSLYLQQGRGYSALATGASAVPFAVGSAISAALSGRFVYRAGRRMVLIGLLTVTCGLVAIAVIVGRAPAGAMWLYILAPLSVTGLGSGLVIGPNQTLALQYVATSDGSSAAAMVQTGQRIGMSVGAAVAATIYFGQLDLHGNYAAAASHSFYAAAALVGVALLIGVAELAGRGSG